MLSKYPKSSHYMSQQVKWFQLQIPNNTRQLSVATDMRMLQQYSLLYPAMVMYSLH